MIVFSIQIVTPDERRTVLLRTLGSMLGPTRVAPGCLDARLYSDLDKRKTLLLVEEWDSRDQFERNLNAAKLNAIVAAIELSTKRPWSALIPLSGKRAWTRWRFIGPSFRQPDDGLHKPIVRPRMARLARSSQRMGETRCAKLR